MMGMMKELFTHGVDINGVRVDCALPPTTPGDNRAAQSDWATAAPPTVVAAPRQLPPAAGL